jgi:hypothetical protein
VGNRSTRAGEWEQRLGRPSSLQDEGDDRVDGSGGDPAITADLDRLLLRPVLAVLEALCPTWR